MRRATCVVVASAWVFITSSIPSAFGYSSPRSGCGPSCSTGSGVFLKSPFRKDDISRAPVVTESASASKSECERSRPSRRSLLASWSASFVGVASTLLLPPPKGQSTNAANAAASGVPSVTLAEFESILRDSAKSVLVVEFSGPKQEFATVRLVDGTSFDISDLVESPTDPRSPLKLAAICRSYKIPTKFSGIETALKTTSQTAKKKKVYVNAREAEAAEKERSKKERMAKDEEERLAALYKMEIDEEAQARAGGGTTP